MPNNQQEERVQVQWGLGTLTQVMPRFLFFLLLYYTGYALPCLSQERQVVLEFAGTVDYCLIKPLAVAEKQGNSDLALKLTGLRNKSIGYALKRTGISPSEYDAYATSGASSGLFAAVAKEEGGCSCMLAKLMTRKQELIDRFCVSN